MAKKAGKAFANKNADKIKPKFPYTISPNSLRKLLAMIPNRPKPAKLSQAQLAAWGFTSSNDRNMIPVLKAVNLIDASGTPTATYEAFMLKTGPAALGAEIRKAYAPLFEATHNPQDEQPDELKRLFNLKSGGGESTINPQIQTFKALCEFASFDTQSNGASGSTNQTASNGSVGNAALPSGSSNGNGQISGPSIHIDLHIHLPENKSSREYKYIIEDIARYIYRQEVSSDE